MILLNFDRFCGLLVVNALLNSITWWRVFCVYICIYLYDLIDTSTCKIVCAFGKQIAHTYALLNGYPSSI